MKRAVRLVATAIAVMLLIGVSPWAIPHANNTSTQIAGGDPPDGA